MKPFRRAEALKQRSAVPRTAGIGTTGPQKPRLLLFPGITGEDASFRDTMSLVLPDHPGEMMPYPAATAATEVLTSLPLAAEWAMLRIPVHREGEPFVLVGYSYGGNLAFEVAHRMIARGLGVDLLVLIDPALTNTAFSIFGDAPAKDGSSARVGGTVYALRLVRILLAVLSAAMPSRMRRKLQRRILYELRIHARRAWRPVPIGTQTLHIVSGQLAPVVARGWAELCPRIRQVSISGSHIDILRLPRRLAVADAILSALEGVAVTGPAIAE